MQLSAQHRQIKNRLISLLLSKSKQRGSFAIIESCIQFVSRFRWRFRRIFLVLHVPIDNRLLDSKNRFGTVASGRFQLRQLVAGRNETVALFIPDNADSVDCAHFWPSVDQKHIGNPGVLEDVLERLAILGLPFFLCVMFLACVAIVSARMLSLVSSLVMGNVLFSCDLAALTNSCSGHQSMKNTPGSARVASFDFHYLSRIIGIRQIIIDQILPCFSRGGTQSER